MLAVALLCSYLMPLYCDPSLVPVPPPSAPLAPVVWVLIFFHVTLLPLISLSFPARY